MHCINWGEMIFQTKELEKGWDGIYQGRGGKACPSDVYTYLIQLTNVYGKAYKLTGHITLMQ